MHFLELTGDWYKDYKSDRAYFKMTPNDYFFVSHITYSVVCVKVKLKKKRLVYEAIYINEYWGWTYYFPWNDKWLFIEFVKWRHSIQQQVVVNLFFVFFQSMMLWSLLIIHRPSFANTFLPAFFLNLGITQWVFIRSLDCTQQCLEVVRCCGLNQKEQSAVLQTRFINRIWAFCEDRSVLTVC